MVYVYPLSAAKGRTYGSLYPHRSFQWRWVTTMMWGSLRAFTATPVAEWGTNGKDSRSNRTGPNTMTWDEWWHDADCWMYPTMLRVEISEIWAFPLEIILRWQTYICDWIHSFKTDIICESQIIKRLPPAGFDHASLVVSHVLPSTALFL